MRTKCNRSYADLVAERIDDAVLDAWRGFLNAHAQITRRIDRDLADAGLPDLGWYDLLWALGRVGVPRVRDQLDEGHDLLRRMWPVYAAGIERHFGEVLGADAQTARELFTRLAGSVR